MKKINGFIKLLTTRAVVFFGGLNPACGGINIHKNILMSVSNTFHFNNYGHEKYLHHHFIHFNANCCKSKDLWTSDK